MPGEENKELEQTFDLNQLTKGRRTECLQKENVSHSRSTFLFWGFHGILSH